MPFTSKLGTVLSRYANETLGQAPLATGPYYGVSAGSTTIQLQYVPFSVTFAVYKNGLRLTPGGDYILVGDKVQLFKPLNTGDTVVCDYSAPTTIASPSVDNVKNLTYTPGASGFNISLSYIPVNSTFRIYWNGRRLVQNYEYFLLGTTVTLVSPFAINDVLSYDYQFYNASPTIPYYNVIGKLYVLSNPTSLFYINMTSAAFAVMYVNGLRRSAGTDFGISDPAYVQYLSTLPTGTIVMFDYLGAGTPTSGVGLFPTLAQSSMVVQSSLSGQAIASYPVSFETSWKTKIVQFLNDTEQSWTVRKRLHGFVLQYSSIDGYTLSVLRDFFYARKGRYIDAFFANSFSLYINNSITQYCAFDQDDFTPTVGPKETFSLSLKIRQIRPNDS
jgi:hypothetical protein